MAAEGATVWVHDYQLQLVPQMLRELRPDLRIGFYLHIPFPPDELFQQLPWRRQILEGLLGADLVGFQLAGGAANFVRLVRQRVGHKTHRDLVYLPDGRTVRAAAFPISIDAAGFEELARSEPVAAAGQGDPRGARQPAQDLPRRRPARLHQGHLRPAARVRRADRRRHTSTSRTPSSSRSRRRRASGSSSTASCATTSTGWSAGSTATSARSAGPAISYMHSSYPREEMAALYRAADIMVVTPYRDGMNLVAKEYVACRYDDDGALVLSEFAGAADELRQAWLVNPYDINGMKAALLEACRADDRGAHPADEGDAQDGHPARRRRLGPRLPRRAGRRPCPRTARRCGRPRSPERGRSGHERQRPSVRTWSWSSGVGGLARPRRRRCRAISVVDLVAQRRARHAPAVVVPVDARAATRRRGSPSITSTSSGVISAGWDDPDRLGDLEQVAAQGLDVVGGARRS